MANANTNLKTNVNTNVEVNTNAIADMGTIINHLTLASPCGNKQVTLFLVSIRMPYGQTLQSTHSALLKEKSLHLKA